MSFKKAGACVITAACMISLLSAAHGFAQSAKTVKKDTVSAAPAVKQPKPQTTCPIMGGDIDKKLFVDYKGKRIYVCCPGCLEQVKKDPEAAIKKLAALGQEPETIVAAKPLKAGQKKAAVQDSTTKAMNKSGATIKKMDMSGTDMAKDSSIKVMDHDKMK